MAFDGEAFVQDLRDELAASGRGLDKANWVERVVQGEATPQELVGWARQHYWGVTYHTRRFLSAWVVRMPYEMTDSVIENIAEEVLGTMSKSGHGHLHWLFEFTQGARRAGRGDHRGDAERRRRGQRELPLQPGPAAAVVRVHLRRRARHREPDPRVHTRASSRGSRRTTATSSRPTTTASTRSTSTSTRSTAATSASSPSGTSTRTRSGARRRAAYLAGAEITRRCWGALEGATW